MKNKKIIFNEEYVKWICEEAYNEDKERINKAIKYLAKR